MIYIILALVFIFLFFIQNGNWENFPTGLVIILLLFVGGAIAEWWQRKRDKAEKDAQ